MNKKAVDTKIFASIRPNQSCLKLITRTKDAMIFNIVETVVKIPYLRDFSSSRYISNNK